MSFADTRTIEPFPDAQDFDDLDKQELDAINDYDYETARFLCETRREMRNTNIQDATEHYTQQLEDYNTKFAKLLEEKKARNEENYQRDVEAALQRLEQRIDAMAEAQLRDLKELEGRWREARAYQTAQIEKSVRTLLSSSQLLAKSRRFDEAIEMRDKAREIEGRKKQPKIEECDREFREQFEQTLIRQELAFNELIEQHNELLALLEDKREAADRTAEAECSIDTAYAAVEIMDVALADDKNPDAAIPVVKHFSPRANKVGMGTLRATALLDAEEETELEEDIE